MKYFKTSSLLELKKSYIAQRGQSGHMTCSVRDIVAIRVSEHGAGRLLTRSVGGESLLAHTNDGGDGTLTSLDEAWDVEGCTSLYDLETNFSQENIELVPMEDEDGEAILVNEEYEDTVRFGIAAARKKQA